jgi:hypothetical protein
MITAMMITISIQPILAIVHSSLPLASAGGTTRWKPTTLTRQYLSTQGTRGHEALRVRHDLARGRFQPKRPGGLSLSMKYTFLCSGNSM